CHVLVFVGTARFAPHRESAALQSPVRIDGLGAGNDISAVRPPLLQNPEGHRVYVGAVRRNGWTHSAELGLCLTPQARKNAADGRGGPVVGEWRAEPAADADPGLHSCQPFLPAS